VPTLRTKLGELERALTQTAAAAKSYEGRVRALEGELRQLQADALQKPDLKAKEARILHLESQLGEAQSNLDRLQAQLSAQVDSANAALLTDVKRLNDEQQERALRIKMLTARVAELEAYAEQNAALRGERDGLRGELERLKGASEGPPRAPRAEPRALVDVNKAADHAKPAQSGTKRRVNDSELTLEFSLKQNLSHLMTREPSLIAVVSDDNGFPVAGVGSEHSQEGVSVLTSLAQELALRVNEFVDLDRIERMELADVAGRALRVRFFDWEAQPLALGCLGKRSLVSNQDEETVVATFPKLLRRAWSA
jgi:DNA repair exonuclease SbcCD ATPase subunit